MKHAYARSLPMVFAVLTWTATASAQTPPPECTGLLPNNVIDMTVRPASFRDVVGTVGHDVWAFRGQFVPFTSFEINLGPDGPGQQISLILSRTADDAVLYSKTLGPPDFQTYGSAHNKWRHKITAAEAGPGDTWRVARIRTSKAPTAPAFLNRLKFGLQGVFEPAVELVDQNGPVGMRVTLRIEPTGPTTCADDPSLCLCATYPLTCSTPGPNGTFKCFSAPTN